MNKLHLECLGKAFEEILGQPEEGTMSYVRCLSFDIIKKLFKYPLNKEKDLLSGYLFTPEKIEIFGWEIYAVSDDGENKEDFITSDKAVDLREQKKGSILLFLDESKTGPGMDGIYSSVREIKETELFEKANKIVLKKLPQDIRNFSKKASKKAGKIGVQNTISPWKEFDFYVQCAYEPWKTGLNITSLGLWPIYTHNNKLKLEDIDISVQIIEKLMLTKGALNTVKARIDSLLLIEPEEKQIDHLKEFLQNSEGLHWTDTLLKLNDYPDLWLNKLKPGFATQELHSIELIPWRKSEKTPPYTWSGLKLQEDNIPVFHINKENEKPVKLEVRWKTRPEELKEGSVSYNISIITGSDYELANKIIPHSGKKTEKCVFTRDDFIDEVISDETGKWEVIINIYPTGSEKENISENNQLFLETDSFILTFEDYEEELTMSTVGKTTRALVEEAIRFSDKEDFEKVCNSSITEDKKGYISYRVNGKSARVFRPPLIKFIEEKWESNKFIPGRWIVRVRDDGQLVLPVEFREISDEACNIEVRKKIDETTRNLANKAMERCGFMGFIYHDSDLATKYVNSWITALENGNPEVSLASTVEVQSQTGNIIGLIVLPSHPLLVAWHQAYDELVYYSRYEENLKQSELLKTLEPIDGSYIPTFLPGLSPESSFVFGDTLGFYAIAMIKDKEPEPQAAIALLARCLDSTGGNAAPSVGKSTSRAIACEIDKYSRLHDSYKLLKINSVQPGDGLTVVTALGMALSQVQKEENDDEENTEERLGGYVLNMFPSKEILRTSLVGRYITEMTAKRRSGVFQAGSLENTWMWKTYEKDGIFLPRLKWTKSSESEPQEPAHLTIAFDTFKSYIYTYPEDKFGELKPIETFGLYPSLIRTFTFNSSTWNTTVAINTEGEKHPLNRIFTDRLNKIHTAILRLVAKNLSNNNSWPVLITEITDEKANSLKNLHKLSDWVITVDRNAGLEFFDAPRENPEIYDTYVIDCVPERQDLNSVQLVTSTSHVEEVKLLLDQALMEMGLSCSPKNCSFLLSKLKAISGRLAMKLSNYKDQSRGELIALALFYSSCEEYSQEQEWLSLNEGFLVPLDDVKELVLPELREKTLNSKDCELIEHSGVRADMVYVSLDKKGKFKFTFIEIKYRRLLSSTKNIDLIEHIRKQTGITKKKWFEKYFSTNISKTQLAVRRKRLARALHFYASKANRHSLEEKYYNALTKAIDKLYYLDDDNFLSQEPNFDRGYLFCPEYKSDISDIDFDGFTRIYLFGAKTMPDKSKSNFPMNFTSKNEDIDSLEKNKEITLPEKDKNIESTIKEEETIKIEQDSIGLLMGHTFSANTPVDWKISIKGNPHLMIVGLPGMGKTTCIVNICHNLYEQNITPVIFSYHADIEDKLKNYLNELNFIDMEEGLGFNPLYVVGKNQNSWLDNVGMLRDIFSAIYPDFGEIQTNEIREALKNSYIELGYGVPDIDINELPIPKFQRFYDILKQNPKTNKGIIARLDELNDYGFFKKIGAKPGLLDITLPTVIRISTLKNEVMQKALAAFILFSIYQNMFLRGEQERITHAVIFDEAHRASNLKLIPTMAKESRKYGISFIVSSQSAKDFHQSLYSAIANYLILRVIDIDAKILSKTVAPTDTTKQVENKLKQLEKFTAMFFCEGNSPRNLRLSSPE